MSTPKRITLTVIVLFALAALTAGLFISQYLPVKKTIDRNQFNGTLLESPREINQFSLMGIDNQPFTNTSLQGQWTMLFFGFTNCGYLCPTTMAMLGKMYRKLEAKKVSPLPRVVMVSIDPQRDSLDKLSQYVKAFDPHFYGARGGRKMVKEMASEMGIAYVKVALANAGKSQNYDIQHSGAIMLFNPRGELSAFFTTGNKPDLLAKDYQLLVS